MDLRYTNPAVYERGADDVCSLLAALELERQGVLNQQEQELLDSIRSEIGQERIDATIEDWLGV